MESIAARIEQQRAHSGHFFSWNDDDDDDVAAEGGEVCMPEAESWEEGLSGERDLQPGRHPLDVE